MFFQLMIAMFFGLACPSHTSNTNHNGTTVNSTEGDETPVPAPDVPGDDTGGQTGQNPPR